VVWLGESVVDPAGCELVVKVRVEDPMLAVIVTDVALVACQFRVTLCPELMEFVLAENTRVGGLEPLLVPVLVVLLLEQEHKHNAVAINPRAIPRTQLFVISSCARYGSRYRRATK
jgi:hypothetical protein